MGPSGAGKTYLSKELRKFGLNSVDADSIDQLHSWYDSKGNKVEYPENADKEFFDNHSFLWGRNFLVEYLKENPDIYLFGASGNVFEMLDLFDKVYYLDIPEGIQYQRLQHETRRNPMGRTEFQRKNAIAWAKELRQKAQELGLEFIDATKSSTEIFKQLT